MKDELELEPDTDGALAAFFLADLLAFFFAALDLGSEWGSIRPGAAATHGLLMMLTPNLPPTAAMRLGLVLLICLCQLALSHDLAVEYRLEWARAVPSIHCELHVADQEARLEYSAVDAARKSPCVLVMSR